LYRKAVHEFRYILFLASAFSARELRYERVYLKAANARYDLASVS